VECKKSVQDRYTHDSCERNIKIEDGLSESKRGKMGQRWHWNENHELGIGSYVHKKSISTVKRVEFVSDRMSYISLRGCWCDIVLNVRAQQRIKLMI
jgi:hypothetical protein